MLCWSWPIPLNLATEATYDNTEEKISCTLYTERGSEEIGCDYITYTIHVDEPSWRVLKAEVSGGNLILGLEASFKARGTLQGGLFLTPLSDLKAEFGTVQIMEATGRVTYRCLWFELDGRAHMIPFAEEPKLDRVWLHVSGDTIDDMTLMPSYVSEGVHGFIRDGHWMPC